MKHVVHFSLRLLWAGAILLALAGQALFWLAVPVPAAFLSPSASAKSEDPARQSAPLSRDASTDRRRLLQSSVDSVALSLGGIFQVLPETPERRAALVTSLNSLTFELGGEIYFTAWDGTRVLHSPLSPDIRGTDFVDALDQRGQPFVRTMAALAAKGGGFLQVALPRPKNLCLLRTVPVPSLTLDAEEGILPSPSFPNAATESPFPASPPPVPERALPGASGLPPPPAVLESEPVEQLLYVRRIPHSPWHIAAFMPAGAPPTYPEGFSPVFSDAQTHMDQARADATLRRGLRIFGFALTGLACLLAYKLYKRGHALR
jgi:hypothetical protein